MPPLLPVAVKVTLCPEHALLPMLEEILTAGVTLVPTVIVIGLDVAVVPQVAWYA